MSDLHSFTASVPEGGKEPPNRMEDKAVRQQMREFAAASPLQKFMDWLFGRDFFISYRWEDGRAFALALAKALKAEGFDCFLDSEGFLKGDDWRQVGDRELRKTNSLVLVCSPCMHKSEAVARELKVFRATGRRIIAVAFGDALSRELYPRSPVLAVLPDSIIRHEEPADGLKAEPSIALMDELKRTFIGERAAKRRLRVTLAAAVSLAVLAVASLAAALVAWGLYEQGVRSSSLKDAQLAAGFAEALDVPAALAHYQRSLEANPHDSTTMGGFTRLLIECPPVMVRPLWSGQVADLHMASMGGVPRALLTHEGELLLSLRGGTSWMPLSQIGDSADPKVKVEHIHLSEDGSHLIASTGNRVRMWLTKEGQVEGSWQDLGREVTCVAVDDSGRWAAGLEDGTIRVSESDGNQWSPPTQFDQPLRQVALLRAPLALGAADDHAQWRVWDAERREVGYHLDDDEPVDAVTFLPEGLVWASTSDGGELNGDDARSQISLHDFTGGKEDAGGVSSPPASRRFATLLAAHGRACLSLWNTGEALLTVDLPESHNSCPRPGVLACGLTQNVAVTAHSDGTLRRWRSRDFSVLNTVANSPPGVSRLLVDAGGSRVLIVAEDGLYEVDFPEAEATADIRVHPSETLPDLPPSFIRAEDHADGRFAASGARLVREAEPDWEEGRWQVIGTEGRARHFQHAMTEDEINEVDAVSESSHFAIFPTTHGTLAWGGEVAATAAGADDVQVWSLGWRSEKVKTTIHLGDRVFPHHLKLDERGAALLVASRFFPGDASQWQVFDTSTGKSSGGSHALHPGEVFWGANPQLSEVLISATEEVQVRDAVTGQRTAGPVSLNSRVWFACFLNHGQAFLVAARSGHFRIYRTADASPLCQVTEFDAVAPVDQGAPDDDYRFTVYVEREPGDLGQCRRLAFEISSSGVPAVEPIPGFRVFDFGLSSSVADRGNLVRLVRELGGASLGDRGQLVIQTPSRDASLLNRAEQREFWDEDDMWLLARYLLAGPQERPHTPLHSISAKSPVWQR